MSFDYGDGPTEEEEAAMRAHLEYEHEVTQLILHGEVDAAMLLICQKREPALGITPKQAQLVRAGLAAGRLLEQRDMHADPRPLPGSAESGADEGSGGTGARVVPFRRRRS
jgi:hypothetical protein